jgi:murein DD-endopeptidase MepM/ murein hydrolase activator NlpD
MSRKLPWFLALALILAVPLGPARAGPSTELRAGPERGLAEQSAEPPQETFHVVQRGETLFLIAQRYGSTVDALAHANGLADPTKIYVGQRLRIPGGRMEIDPQATGPYVVQVGDTLMSIASRYATSWRALARVNGMLSPDVLYAGQVVRVPLVEANSGGRRGMLHVVDLGETLFQIALRHDVPPWSVVNANDVSNPALIYRGQQLLIPGEESGWLPAPFASINVRPLPVLQGETLVLSVRTAEPVTLKGGLFEREVDFVEESGVYYGLAGVHVFTEPGLYELTLTATDGDGRTIDIAADVVVEAGRFGYERIPAAPSLLDPAVVAAERERLDALKPTFTESRGWSGPLQRPCGGTVSSYFGTHRAYNNGPYTSYHAGVDLRGPTGTSVYAPAGGTVVMAEQLAVRGNAVVLDHGWGLLTGYWHLSALEVQVGQEVAGGDLIARIGSTGLSTGAHLHWEMWVGGVNVNPLQWLEPLYPWTDPVEESPAGLRSDSP